MFKFQANMKKRIIFAILFLLNISIISASINLDHECADYRCAEGTDITYFVKIRNNVDKDIVVNYIKVKNELDENIAIYDEANYKLLPNEDYTFNITAKVPIPPTGGYTLDYYGCFGVTIKYPDGVTEVDEVCGQPRRSLTVLPKSKIECEQNNECKSNQVCDAKFFKCRDLNCSYGFAFNNQCISYFLVAGILLIIIFTIILILKTKKKEGKKEIVKEVKTVKKKKGKRVKHLKVLLDH